MLHDDVDNRADILDLVYSIFSDRPLDVVATFLLQHEQEHLSGTAARLFTAYDEFLGILGDSKQRKHLDKLEGGAQDRLYENARNISHRFRDALLELFFDETTELARLTRLYGVF